MTKKAAVSEHEALMMAAAEAMYPTGRWTGLRPTPDPTLCAACGQTTLPWEMSLRDHAENILRAKSWAALLIEAGWRPGATAD